jgi:hypothetical protein
VAAATCWWNADGSLGHGLRFDLRRNGRRGGEPALVDGRLVVPRISTQYHPHHPVCMDQLDVYDPISGAHLARRDSIIHDALSPGGIVSAGGLWWVTDVGQPWDLGVRKPRAQLAVVQPGDHPRLIARAELGRAPWRGLPAIDGDRLYLAYDGRLWCVARDDAGVEAEAEAMAEALILDLGFPPRAEAAVSGQPVSGPLPAGISAEPLVHRVIPSSWWVMPTNDLEGAVSALGGGVAAPGGAEWKPLPAKGVVTKGHVRLWRGEQRVYVAARQLDLRAFAGKSAALCSTVVTVDAPMVLRGEIQAKGVRMVFAGIPMDEHTHVRVQPGTYAVHLMVDRVRLPPMVKALASVALAAQPDPEAELAAWSEHLATHGDRIRWLASVHPEHGSVKTLMGYLEAIQP